MDADSGSTLISGFKRETTREEYLRYFESGHLTDLLMTVPVKKGDCFYIPTGRVHSIGSGILLAEIQQSSDITYRIYDYDRTDFSGQKRELHGAQALKIFPGRAGVCPYGVFTLFRDVRYMRLRHTRTQLLGCGRQFRHIHMRGRLFYAGDRR